MTVCSPCIISLYTCMKSFGASCSIFVKRRQLAKTATCFNCPLCQLLWQNFLKSSEFGQFPGNVCQLLQILEKSLSWLLLKKWRFVYRSLPTCRGHNSTVYPWLGLISRCSIIKGLQCKTKEQAKFPSIQELMLIINHCLWQLIDSDAVVVGVACDIILTNCQLNGT